MRFNPITYNKKEVRAIYNIAKQKNFLYKSPNGMESILDKKFWLLTRTKSFRSWYGDWIDIYTNKLNKGNYGISDKNGEPMLLKHVSNVDIKRFNPDKTKDIGFHFGGDEAINGMVNKKFFRDEKYYIGKYFIRSERILEMKDVSEWKEKFFIQLVLHCYDVDMSYLLENMYFIINTRYHDKDDDMKKIIEYNIKEEINDIFLNKFYGTGEDLFYFFSKFLIHDDTVELNINTDRKKLKNYLIKLAKYIKEPEKSKASYYDIVYGMKAIIEIDSIKYLNNYETANTEYSYMTFDPMDIKSAYNKGLFQNTDVVFENLKHILNYDEFI